MVKGPPRGREPHLLAVVVDPELRAHVWCVRRVPPLPRSPRQDVVLVTHLSVRTAMRHEQVIRESMRWEADAVETLDS